MRDRLVEIHDDSKTIFAIAVKLDPMCDEERAILIDHEGFRADGTDIMLTEIDSMRTCVDPMHWPRTGIHPRTLTIAHLYVQINFDLFPDDTVLKIDVSQILGALLYPPRDPRMPGIVPSDQ